MLLLLQEITAYSIQTTLLIMQKLVQCSATVVSALRIALPSQYTVSFINSKNCQILLVAIGIQHLLVVG